MGCGADGGDDRCLKSYPDERPCLRLSAGDYDCEGGTGNGPNYIPGPVTVRHDVDPDDPFDLDRDGNGIGCE
jgi:hypothetical protein